MFGLKLLACIKLMLISIVCYGYQFDSYSNANIAYSEKPREELDNYSSQDYESSRYVTITLKDIENIKGSEEKDELFISIFEHKKNERPKLYRVPNFPEYWLSNLVEQLKDVVIWEGIVRKNNSTNLMISLLEQDLAPWDNDDLLGTIRYMFYYDSTEKQFMMNSKTVKQGNKNNKGEFDPLINDTHTFTLNGDDSLYKITLEVSIKNSDDCLCKSIDK